MSFRTVLRLAVLMIPAWLAWAGQDFEATRSITVPEAAIEIEPPHSWFRAGGSAARELKENSNSPHYTPILATSTGIVPTGTGASLGPPQ